MSPSISAVYLLFLYMMYYKQSGINFSILANKSLEVQNSSDNEKLNENLKLAW